MADVVGYSSLMGTDEAATLKTLTTYHSVMNGLVRQHGGRVVEAPGDAVLAEFSSVVDAVQCAVAVQKELGARNAELPENRRMQFRIGINLGDVIEEGDKIYGDGVNIAARLEAMAEPGGICISKTAFDHIETKLPLGYEYLGEQTLKNIVRPIGAYRVLMEPRVTVAREVRPEKTAQRRFGKPLITAAIILAVAAVSWEVWKSGGFSSLVGKTGAPTGPSVTSPGATSPAVGPSQETIKPSATTPAPTASLPEKPATPPRTTAIPEVSVTKETATTPGGMASSAAPSSKATPSPSAKPSAAVAPSPATVRPGTAASFKQVDKNADGQLSLEEFLGWRGENFARLDTNRDGFLSRAELATGGTRLAQRSLKYFDHLDTNQDQQLSREEFQAAGKRRFLQLDRNVDGRLTLEEWAAMEAEP